MSFFLISNARNVSRYYTLEQDKNMDAKRNNKMAAPSDSNFFFSFFRVNF